jgi:hypothetical protein
MSSIGRCVSAGTVVLKYGAANVASTQKEKPLLSSKRRPRLQTYKRSWNEQKYGHWSRRDPKPRTTVLTRTASNLLLSYAMLNLNVGQGHQQITVLLKVKWVKRIHELFVHDFPT